jgi:hypothetical protein
MVGESSHAIEEHTGSSDVANQHATEQQHNKETAPAAASGNIMGFILVDGGGTKNPTTEAPVVKAAVVEEKPKIEEIVRPKEESEVVSGCSTKKTTQTGPSTNCRG